MAFLKAVFAPFGTENFSSSAELRKVLRQNLKNLYLHGVLAASFGHNVMLEFDTTRRTKFVHSLVNEEFISHGNYPEIPPDR